MPTEQILGSGPSGDIQDRGLTLLRMRHTFFFRASAGVCEGGLACEGWERESSQPYKIDAAWSWHFDLNCLPSLRAGVSGGVVRLLDSTVSLNVCTSQSGKS